MLWISIGLIVFGIGKVFIPKYFKFYKIWEIFGKLEEPSRLELLLDRLVGFVCLFIGIVFLVNPFFK